MMDNSVPFIWMIISPVMMILLSIIVIKLIEKILGNDEDGKEIK